MTVAEESRVEVKHKKASQGRKRQNYSVKDSKKDRREEEDRITKKLSVTAV